LWLSCSFVAAFPGLKSKPREKPTSASILPASILKMEAMHFSEMPFDFQRYKKVKEKVELSP
jgi:hypothetical protein